MGVSEGVSHNPNAKILAVSWLSKRQIPMRQFRFERKNDPAAKAASFCARIRQAGVIPREFWVLFYPDLDEKGLELRVLDTKTGQKRRANQDTGNCVFFKRCLAIRRDYVNSAATYREYEIQQI